MKVLVIGATGTIGSAVVEALQPDHEVIGAGHSGGEPRVEITSGDSLRALFRRVGALDAVVCAAGPARFGSLETLADEDFAFSVRYKLMGQVGVSRAALAHRGVGILVAARPRATAARYRLADPDAVARLLGCLAAGSGEGS